MSDDKMKEIIISSLHFLVVEKRVRVYGFVIMPNHIHMVWQIQDGYEKAKVQQSFLKYTAQQMKFLLIKTNAAELAKYKVKASNRQYQFWERNPLVIDLWSRIVFLQKLNDMHHNPVRPYWKLCQYPQEYKYSSARFYEHGIDDFGLPTHYLS